jgi:hypothetical protein
MKNLLILLFLIFQPFLLMAGLEWREFDLSAGGKKQVTTGKAKITIETRVTEEQAFKEDHLSLTAQVAGRKGIHTWFDSSYGRGAVALHGDLLLLKYGVGRGTCARDEHIRIYKLSVDSLQELCDVQTSYYVNSLQPHITSPDRIDYQIKAEAAHGYTVFSFWTADRGRGLPAEKKVMVKNDG